MNLDPTCIIAHSDQRQPLTEGCRLLNVSWCNEVVFYGVNNVHDMDRQYFGDEPLPEYGTYLPKVVNSF